MDRDSLIACSVVYYHPGAPRPGVYCSDLSCSLLPIGHLILGGESITRGFSIFLAKFRVDPVGGDRPGKITRMPELAGEGRCVPQF